MVAPSRVRIGITAPLLLPNLDTGVLRLPYIKERNFAAAKTQVWLESKRPLTCNISGLTVEAPGPAISAVRGEFADKEMLNPALGITASRSPESRLCWASDKAGSPGAIVVQRIEERPLVRIPRVVVVIDGSHSMARHAPELAKALEAIPSGVDCGVILASDRPDVIRPLGSDASANWAAGTVAKFAFLGGCDNVPALAMALDMAAKDRQTAVLWIHGPQPESIGSPDVLVQFRQRRPETSRIFTMEAEPGTEPGAGGSANRRNG